ncbi:MAG: hypothetical protein JXR13_07120 [Thalassovita sp.]
MDEKTERELHELTLNAITQGRLLAQEWREAGLAPQGSTKQLTLDLLQKLADRSGLYDLYDERIELLGNQIRRFANAYREGLGDRALETDIDTENVPDTKVIDLINLAWRWRQLRSGHRKLEDKIAAIRETGRLLAGN